MRLPMKPAVAVTEGKSEPIYIVEDDGTWKNYGAEYFPCDLSKKTYVFVSIKYTATSGSSAMYKYKIGDPPISISAGNGTYTCYRTFSADENGVSLGAPTWGNYGSIGFIMAI